MRIAGIMAAVVLCAAAIGCDDWISPSEPTGSRYWVEIVVVANGIGVSQADVRIEDSDSGDVGTGRTSQEGIAGPYPWTSKVERALVSVRCVICSYPSMDPYEVELAPTRERSDPEYGTVSQFRVEVGR